MGNKAYWLNKVAVILSTKGDEGFYTRGASQECITDSTLCHLISNNQLNEAITYFQKTYPETHLRDIKDLEVTWVHRGVNFTIIEVNGIERILYEDKINWLTSE